MKRLEIHKFGGTSVADAQRILAACRLMVDRYQQSNIVVVSSATAGTTDMLVKVGRAAALGEHGDVQELCDQMEQRHLAILKQFSRPNEETVGWEITALIRVVRRLGEAAAINRLLSPRARDRILITGEKLAVRLWATAFQTLGASAAPMDADRFLETDGQFGRANAIPEIADRTIRHALSPVVAEGSIPVVTGFCGRGPDGATTTLGRGGSDLSATLLAAAMNADEVTIWTDVDGVFSANPRVVADARVIQHLNYREAAEMSYYGAKVLHQRTMIPVMEKRIPVWTRNSLKPEARGTVIDGCFSPGSHPVKAVSAILNQALLSVEGKGMSGAPGFAARLFDTLAEQEISVTMISQSSSEASICLAIPREDVDLAESALKREFRPELSRRDIEEIAVRRYVGLVAVVGLGMAQTPGVAGRTTAVLGKQRINILALAQGSSELNITIALDEADIDHAVRVLHREFGLHRVDTGVETRDSLDLIVLGCGNVGRAFIDLVEQRRVHIKERFGLEPRLLAVGDRSGFLLDPTGIPRQRIEEVIAAKNEGRRIGDWEQGVSGSARQMMGRVLGYRLTRPVLIDTSDADDAHDVFLAAFEGGCDVVTANKKPLAGEMEIFRRLQTTCAQSGAILKAEATVGAGLPVVDTLEMLVGTGDRLVTAQGSLSGTLGFIMSCLEREIPLSRAVAMARDQGFTEPDPAVDLSGIDVARKATILGRLAGLVTGHSPVALTGLVDASWIGLPYDTLIERLGDRDHHFAAQVAEAKKQGKVLRYLAQVEREQITVGPQAVPADSAAGRLAGTENLIVFNSERYQSIPLVITGPGAGVEVTAMGVLGDVLRIAAERGEV